MCFTEGAVIGRAVPAMEWHLLGHRCMLSSIHTCVDCVPNNNVIVIVCAVSCATFVCPFGGRRDQEKCAWHNRPAQATARGPCSGADGGLPGFDIERLQKHNKLD